MESQELISVIIPVYGVEKYLDKCIQSIVKQTYKNLQIILVDDGSPDGCPKICDAWKQKDARIMVIHKVNGGLSDARNVGLNAAQGKYISFIDSDDYIEERMIEIMHQTIKREKADLVICDFSKVTESGQVVDSESMMKTEILSGLEGLKKLTYTGDWNYVTAVNKLYSADVLKEIKFPLGKIHEDEFVVHRVFYRCKKIAVINQKLYKYVQREGSITKGTESVKGLDIVEAFVERIMFYEENGLSEYLPALLTRLKSIYNRQRLLVPKVYTKEEKKRIKEIDRIFRKNYLGHLENISLKERTIYTMPSIWFWYVKKRIEIMRKSNH